MNPKCPMSPKFPTSRPSKRVFALLLALCFVFPSFFAVPFVAEEEPTVQPPQEEVLPPIYMKTELSEGADVLTVELYTDGIQWTALDFGLKYDPAVLTLSAVSEGQKILSARRKGFDFLVMNRDIEASNQSGYCNFVATVGSATCNVTRYSGAIAIYTFAVTDLTKAVASLEVCVSTLVDASGTPLVEYTSFGPGEEPVVHLSQSANLFRYGDLNRDGVTIYDAMLIMQQLVDMTQLNEYQLAAAKVSGGEELSIFDAMLIMQYLVGMIETFPAEA